MILRRNNSLFLSFVLFYLLAFTNLENNQTSAEQSTDELNLANNSGNIQWSTYLGGSFYDSAKDLAVDSLDNVIVIGFTSSDNFPALNGYNEVYGGLRDAFVSKVHPSGNLAWSTYLGGFGVERGVSVAIDSEDYIIITGSTWGDDFPVLNAYDETFNGGLGDVFVSKFDPNGNLVWSTYLGGSGNDYATAAAIDSQDNIIITGFTHSVDFPVINGYDEIYGNKDDAFISKFNSFGEILWSTYLGGSDDEQSNSVAIDSQDNIIITGFTSSEDFPGRAVEPLVY